MTTPPNIAMDPIGFVLEHLWADATENGRWEATKLLRSYVATKNYAEAMMLAIAIELDAAKRREHETFWTQTVPAIEAAGLHDKVSILDELGKRRLFWFLAAHRDDWRELRGTGTPPGPITFTDADIDAAIPPIRTPPPLAKPCPPPPPVSS